MTLRTGLRLSISTVQRLRSLTPQPGDEGFEPLLTQSGNVIITQNDDIIIVRKEIPV